MYITQISVYLENDHGTLRTLTKTLADAGIDMLGMSIADTANFGIARIVVLHMGKQSGINLFDC